MCGARLAPQLDAWLLSPHLRQAHFSGGRIGDSSPRIFVNFRPEKSDFDLCEVFWILKKDPNFARFWKQVVNSQIAISTLQQQIANNRKGWLQLLKLYYLIWNKLRLNLLVDDCHQDPGTSQNWKVKNKKIGKDKCRLTKGSAIF
jgi:hypothetical protein